MSELRSTLSLASGRLVAVGATFFIPIVLARLFSPSEFGAYKQLFLIFTTFFYIGQLGMAESLFYFVPRAGARVGRYVANALLFLAAAGAVSLVLLETTGPALAAWLNNPELARHLTLLGVFILLMMASAVLEIVITARGQYGLAAWTYGVSDVMRAVAFAVGALLLGGLDGLLLGAVAVAALRLVATIAYLVRTFGDDVWPDADCLREQLVYAAPFSLAVLLEHGYRSLHQYAVSSQFDPATFAIYSVGCLQIPVIETLGTSAANVLMVRMGQELAAGRADSAVELWRSVTRRMAAVMFGVAGFMVVVSRDLLVLLFTDAYAASAPVFVVTALTLLPSTFMTDSVLRVYAQTRFLVVLNAVRLCATVLAILVLLPTLGLVGAALAGLVAATVGKLVALARMRRLMAVSTRALLPWKSLGAITAAAVLAGLVASLVPARADLPLIARMALDTVVYGVVYGALAMWWGEVSRTAWRPLVAWLPARRDTSVGPAARKALAVVRDP